MPEAVLRKEADVLSSFWVSSGEPLEAWMPADRKACERIDPLQAEKGDGSIPRDHGRHGGWISPKAVQPDELGWSLCPDDHLSSCGGAGALPQGPELCHRPALTKAQGRAEANLHACGCGTAMGKNTKV